MVNETSAARLDRAIEEVIAGRRPAVEPALQPLVEAAATLRAGLAPVPLGPRFEARLASRLRQRNPMERLAMALAGTVQDSRRELGQHARLLRSGALGSAAVGFAGVTFYAVWRAAHRH
jgi:hypothetical protein